MTRVAGQFGAATGTGARSPSGDRPTPPPGAPAVSAMTCSRNPPTAGSAPIAAVACGNHPTPTAAAPTHNSVTGTVFHTPASACGNGRSPPVTATPSQVAAPATLVSST